MHELLVASLNAIYSSSGLCLISNILLDAPEKFNEVKDASSPRFCQAFKLHEFPINCSNQLKSAWKLSDKRPCFLISKQWSVPLWNYVTIHCAAVVVVSGDGECGTSLAIFNVSDKMLKGSVANPAHNSLLKAQSLCCKVLKKVDQWLDCLVPGGFSH